LKQVIEPRQLRFPSHEGRGAGLGSSRSSECRVRRCVWPGITRLAGRRQPDPRDEAVALAVDVFDEPWIVGAITEQPTQPPEVLGE
jgi:hypothetical protein